MKQRILVMNGQRLIENLDENGKWKTIKVSKAESLKGGIYNIFTAKDADNKMGASGILIHTTKDEFFIKTPYGFLKYELTEQIKLPAIGSNINVSYENDQIKILKDSIKSSKKLSI